MIAGLEKDSRFLLMQYPDLRSLAEVDALPMPEFNLRTHCMFEMVKWGAGIFDAPEQSKPAEKRPLIQVLAELKRKKLEEEAKANANTN